MTAPTRVITGAEFVDAVRKLASKSPGRVDADGGRYFTTETFTTRRFDSEAVRTDTAFRPSCLLGHALAALDVDSVDVMGVGANRLSAGVLCRNTIRLPGIEFDTTDFEREWLDRAQYANDHGDTWRDAVAAADDQEGYRWGDEP